jgi:hypothetical protein
VAHEKLMDITTNSERERVSVEKKERKKESNTTLNYLLQKIILKRLTIK